ncbi:MAG: flagellar hook-length control protein FliK [Deltaproteobacteria bacterium]|nr:flagellar hook-length control protein FliK [Deltaproteobacteria bacterium]
MDIIAPIIQQPYNVTPVTPTKAPDGALQHNLLPQQVIQATVVSTTADQAVLDFGKHTITANTQQPLATGQKLNLQVVTTEPQLQFQVVDGKGDPSLLRLLHLFDHRSELGSQLSKLLLQRPSPAGSASSANTAPTNSPATTSAQNLSGPVANPPQGSVAQPATAMTTQNPASDLSASPSQGLPRGAPDPAILRPASLASPTGTAQTTTRGVATPQSQNAAAPNQHTSKLVAGQGNTATTQPLTVSPPTVGAATVAGVPLPSPLPSPLSSLTQGSLLPLQRQALEGALLPQQWGQLEQLSTQIAGDMSTANSKFVVNLARMLGLDFEALLAKDQLDAANAGLKGMLTALKNHSEVAESVRETAAQMSQQLEVLQLCRLRLAQEGVLFLPLPLEFVEQGYVLFEQQGQDGSEADGADGHLVSLNLTLRHLGSLQVNLLFEQQALFVRIKCQDEATVTLVEEYCDELRESLQPFSIRSIQVVTGAQDPALTLLDRLQPQAGQQAPLFDARA